MNDIRIKGLLQAKVLGCLDTQDNAAFLLSLKNDNEFPWQEFGQYQNLVAHMPTLLEIETPGPEIKIKILKEFQDQIKLTRLNKKSEKDSTAELSKPIEMSDDEDLIIEEEEIIPPDIQQKDKVIRGKAVYKNGISIRRLEKPELDINTFKSRKHELTEEKKDIHQKSVVNKGLFDKRPKNYVSKFEKDKKISRPSINELLSSNKLLTIAGAVIVIILIFLLIMYLGLSSEIDNNKNEIERLKKRIGLTIIYEESFPFESRLTG